MWHTLSVLILASADLHYRLPHYDWLLEQAPDFDVVALPGDHLDVTGAVPVPAQAVVLSEYLERLSEATQLVVTSGNHDLDGPGTHGEQVPGWLERCAQRGVAVDGARVDVEDTRFSLCPWWDGPTTKAAVDAQLKVDSVDRPETWIWLYHSPPAGTPLCTTGRREFPDEDLAAWIETYQPDYVFTGHIHQAPFVDGGSWLGRIGETWVFNAGRTAGPVPAHVIVDTDARTAEWWAPPHSDTRSLDDVPAGTGS